jgi:hypothetical protein
MPRHYKLEGSPWSLDYEKYPAAELREFIEARIGTTLSEKERRTIGNCNRYQLANRLRKIDLASTFPRFMELPPEIRLSVYELLLVDIRERSDYGLITNWYSGPDRFRLHPAVLGTSKQIHSEAQPILYRKNKFEATIMAVKYRQRTECLLKVVLPGRAYPYRRTMASSREISFLRELFRSSTMGRLRCLTHLTINLNLLTPEDHESNGYVPRARDAVACLCLSLTGSSKMKELTINVGLGDPQGRGKVDFARILWPLVFLRTDIVVEFEGIAELLRTTTTDARSVPHAEAFYGKHIAKIRQLCTKEIGKQGSGLVDFRDVEAALASMSFFGDEFVQMDDIVNLSTAWTGMRGEADRVEAMGLEKESLL